MKDTSKILKRGMVLSLALVMLSVMLSVVYAQTSNTCPIAVYEGEKVRLAPEAYDPDPEVGPAGQLIWSVSRPFDLNGEWQTVKGKRGIFNFWVKVSDGELYDIEYGCVEVLPKNRDPVLQPIADFTVVKGESTRLYATCSDPDNDRVKIDYYVDGRNMAYLLYQPAGKYRFTVMCTDGFGGADYEYATMTVKETIPQAIKRVLKKVFIPEEEPPAPVEVVEPEPVVEEIEYTEEYCDLVCGAQEDIELVIHEKAYELIGDGGSTRTFVLGAKKEEPEPEPVVEEPIVPTKPICPAPKVVEQDEPVIDEVEKTIMPLKTAWERKLEVDAAYNCEC